MVGLCTGESCAALERLAMVEGESASIPWTHISHEELTYLLQKFLLVIKTKCQTHNTRGRVGRYKPSRDPDRHAKDDNQYTNHAQISSHSGSPYVHATGITNFNTSIYRSTTPY